MSEALTIIACGGGAWISALFADSMFEDGYAVSGFTGLAGTLAFGGAACIFLYRAVFP